MYYCKTVVGLIVAFRNFWLNEKAFERYSMTILEMTLIYNGSTFGSFCSILFGASSLKRDSYVKSSGDKLEIKKRLTIFNVY